VCQTAYAVKDKKLILQSKFYLLHQRSKKAGMSQTEKNDFTTLMQGYSSKI